MAAIGAGLQLKLFRSSPYQRWRGATLLARREVIKPPPAEPRVGVAIEADGQPGTLSASAIANRLAAEPGIAHVSVVERASPGYLRRLMRTHQLDGLVVGGHSDRWIGELSTGVFPGVKPQGTSVRVVDLRRLCGRVPGSEEATARALLLLLAAVARVRSPDALTPASIDEELRALLGRGGEGLSPCVPILTCPAGLDCLRMIGQLGMHYPPAAIPVETPCHLNMDRRLTARALEFGAVAVLAMGCVPGCARACQTTERQANDSNGRFPSRSSEEEQALATVPIFSLSGLVEALNACLSRFSPRDRPAHAKPDSSYAA